MNEKSFSDNLRQYLESHGSQTEKMHGNMFQVGIPDLLVGLPDGTIVLIETKWTMAYSVTMGEAWSMLRPGQKRVFVTWKEYPVYVVIGGPRGVILLMADHFKEERFDEKLEWVTLRQAVGPLVNDYED